MTNSTLSSLFYANRGNITDKWEQYLAVYDAELHDWHGRDISLLEVGVQNGGSMQVWSKYFGTASRIVGLDIDERIMDLAHPDNVRLVVADGTDAQQVISALGDATFDLIVDDGSHMSADVIKSFRLLFPRLNPGGKYIIEDLHCAYWDDFGGGLLRRDSSIEMLKRLIDVLHHDHIDLLHQVELDVTDDLYISLRSSVGRVSFYDSVAVIEKLPFVKTEPYRRVLAGDEGAVMDPLDLLGAFPDTQRLLFAEPLARALESGVTRMFREARDAGNTFEAERLEAAQREAALQFKVDQLLEQLDAERENARLLQADRDLLDKQRLRVEAKTQADRDRREAQRTGRTLAMNDLSDRIVRSNQAKVAAEATALENEQLHSQVSALRGQANDSLQLQHDLGQAVVSLRHEVDALKRSRTYRLLEPARIGVRLARRARQLATARGMRSSTTPDEEIDPTTEGIPSDVLDARRSSQSAAFVGWRQEWGMLGEGDRAAIDAHIGLGGLPALTVLFRVECTDTRAIDASLSALRSQRLLNWTAWVSFSLESESPQTRAAVDKCISRDERIHLADSLALTQLEMGPVVLTSTGTVLFEHALYLLADAAASGARVAYSDAEYSDEEGRLMPVLKPNYSPIHQQLSSYIGDTVLFQGFGDDIGGQLTDFAAGVVPTSAVLEHLMASLATTDVKRIPFIAQHDQYSVPSVPVEDALETIAPVAVSIIIPTRDLVDLLRPCIESLLTQSNYPSELIEIIVVDNGSSDTATLGYLQRLTKLGHAIVIRDDRPFNYPRLNNRAAAIASGEVLVLLNNDTTVLDPLWLRRMVGYAMRPEVGVVGGKLLYPDMSVQHAGVVLGIQGVAAHVNHMLPTDALGYHDIGDRTHEVSAVTGACLAVRAEVYRELGGLDETFAVTFNDIDLCCSSLDHGYRNVYIGHALMVHYESKSRGYDIKPEQLAAFQSEALRARAKFPVLYRDDPYYNPNLSLVRSYGLADPPRAVRPWRLAHRAANRSKCILMLSSTYQVGHGVAVVIDIQARHLASLGHRVILGGPSAKNEFTFDGCERVHMQTAVEGAKFAVECGADVVIMHTPPFYSSARWLGPEQMKIAYDYGEPPPMYFPDAQDRINVGNEKRFGLSLADARFAISAAVQADAGFEDMGVIPLGNAHLATWSDSLAEQRNDVRARQRWSDHLVVLNVCRFHAGERQYKGVDAYAALLNVARTFSPELASRLVFVLVGKADQTDVDEMRAQGLTVFANVTDSEMIGLYAAADAYVNLSRWEGYNLGIGQALALGLPTLASDIPAHRAFGIPTTDDAAEQVEFLEGLLLNEVAGESSVREPKVWSWDAPLEQLARLIDDLA